MECSKKHMIPCLIVMAVVGLMVFVYSASPTLKEPQSALVYHKLWYPAHSETKPELVVKWQFNYFKGKYEYVWVSENVTRNYPDKYEVTFQYESQSGEMKSVTKDVDATYFMSVFPGQEIVVQESWSDIWGSCGVYIK